MNSAALAMRDFAIASMYLIDHCCVSSTEWPPQACEIVRSCTTVVG